MSANRPFGAVQWPTRWTSLMSITRPGSVATPSIRFRHVRGVTTGMEVEWTFTPETRRNARAHRACLERTVVAAD